MANRVSSYPATAKAKAGCRPRTARPASSCQEGFVLAVTLWIIAILALAAAFFAEWASSTTEDAIYLRDRAEAERRFRELKSETLYILATQPISLRGVELFYMADEKLAYSGGGDPLVPAFPVASYFLKLNGYDYDAGNGFSVQLQDARGLLNLNLASQEQISRFLRVAGVPDSEHAALYDMLKDFTDSDNLKRLNGAEARLYKEEGLPPPANRPLATHWEAQRVLGWHDLAEAWQSGFLGDMTTVTQIAGFNPNTAPRELLAIIPGLTGSVEEKIITLRRKTPFRGHSDFQRRSGAPIASFDLTYNFLPGRAVRVSVEDKNLNLRWQFLVTITPNDIRQPWIVSYEMKLPRATYKSEAETKDAPPARTAEKREEYPEPSLYLTGKRKKAPGEDRPDRFIIIQGGVPG